MQGILNYIPETNHVSRVYTYVVLQLFCIYNCATCNVIPPVKSVLYFYISTFCSMCAVSNMDVFCSSLITCFPGMLLRYCQSVLLLLLLLLCEALMSYPFCTNNCCTLHIPHSFPSVVQIPGNPHLPSPHIVRMTKAYCTCTTRHGNR